MLTSALLLVKLSLFGNLFSSQYALAAAAAATPGTTAAPATARSTCTLRPLGHGRDDTDQIEAAVARCGHQGSIVFEPGDFNVTRKMTWDLVESTVDLHGSLNFVPDIDYWLNPDNTYRTVFIQSQSSWFVITGRDFLVDAHGTGGIAGHGQAWWTYFANRTRADGDGRPIALTLADAARGAVRGFRVDGPPFWCNAVVRSADVVYDGMLCNATNTDPAFFGTNLVPNTDGIDTYRSDKISLLNWDITSGDDCLAIKGNSTNILARNITCRGGNGIAVGSLGQYVDLPDIVDNVTFEDVRLIRLDPQIQPNMGTAVYFKTWTGTVNGAPPTGGGGGGGRVSNVVSRNFSLDRVSLPIHLYQTNDGHSTDTPSHLQFSNLTFENFAGTAVGSTIVDIECSPAVPCPGLAFSGIEIQPPAGDTAAVVCKNVVSESGLPACNTTTG